MKIELILNQYVFVEKKLLKSKKKICFYKMKCRPKVVETFLCLITADCKQKKNEETCSNKKKEKLNLFFFEIKKAGRNISKLFQQPWEHRIVKFTMTPKKKSKFTHSAILMEYVWLQRPHTFCHQDKPRSLKPVLMAEVCNSYWQICLSGGF